jgi:hypothetical protein
VNNVLRVVERVFGEGKLQRADGTSLSAGYQLVVYRDWQDTGGSLTPHGFMVEGHVMALPEDLRPLLFTPDPLTLQLDDGRAVRLYVVNEDGAVSGADDKGPQETVE